MHILITIRGAKQSESALRLGAQIARTAHSSVTILNVIKLNKNRAKAEAILARALELLGSEVVTKQGKIRTGDPATEIVREAEEGNYDLIIVGSRSSRNLVERVKGSTGEQVLAHAPTPVLIVKGGNVLSKEPIRHTLVCSSGIDGHEGPSWHVPRLATIFADNEMTILHVMSQISSSPEAREEWQLQADAEKLIDEHTPEGRRLEERVILLRDEGFHVKAKIRHGLVVDEILEEAQSGDYDLVVIGAHQMMGWKHYLLDNVAHQIILQIDRPILIMPTSQNQEPSS